MGNKLGLRDFQSILLDCALDPLIKCLRHANINKYIFFDDAQTAKGRPISPFNLNPKHK